MTPEWLSFLYGLLVGIAGTALAAGRFIGATQARLKALEESIARLPTIEKQLTLICQFQENLALNRPFARSACSFAEEPSQTTTD